MESIFSSFKGKMAGVTNDSRKVKPGYVYVSIHGCRDDGDKYISEALSRGAAAVVREGERGGRAADHVEIIVEDSRFALSDISSNYYGRPADFMEMVGITGTNGKTTTAYLLYGVLKAAGRNPGLMTTVEYRVGERVIPAVRTTMDAPELHSMLADMLKKDCKSVVMEVSSHAVAQKRVAHIDYDMAVFTNLSRDHLDYHGNMDSYFNTKKEFFVKLGSGRKNPFAIINADDSRGMELLACSDISAAKISYGIEAGANVVAEDIVLSPKCTSFSIKSPWGSAKVRSSLLGRYNVSNILAAASVCGVSGIDMGVVGEVLSGIEGVPGRLEEVERGVCGFQVFVDYAHTDDALENVLSTLREITTNRLIVVFGCGGDRDRSKRPVMGKVAAVKADYSYLTSDNPRSEDPSVILDEIKAGFNGYSNYEIITDRREAIRICIQNARSGDVILVAGKGHEKFQEMQNTIIPFDDRQVVREAIASSGVRR